MRPYILAVFTAALFALPTSAAFSQVDVEVGPRGVRVGPSYHRHLYNRSDEGQCRELRQACVHKGQLGEEGMGNCKISRGVPLTLADGNQSLATNNASPYERGVFCVCAL